MIYLSIVRHSVNKMLHVLVHWTASILQYVIQAFHKFHHVQITEVASILHVQWAYTVLYADEHVHVVANDS